MIAQIAHVGQATIDQGYLEEQQDKRGVWGDKENTTHGYILVNVEKQILMV